MESACVLPEYQGRHILSQLLSEAGLLEKGRGCRYLMATIHPDNLFSKNSHLRCGFEELMTVRKYGDWMRTIMVKRL
jgi:L-amino acid N-acyltransferase YncA